MRVPRIFWILLFIAVVAYFLPQLFASKEPSPCDRPRVDIPAVSGLLTAVSGRFGCISIVRSFSTKAGIFYYVQPSFGPVDDVISSLPPGSNVLKLVRGQRWYLSIDYNGFRMDLYPGAEGNYVVVFVH